MERERAFRKVGCKIFQNVLKFLIGFGLLLFFHQLFFFPVDE